MLYGIRREAQEALVRRATARIYVPYGTAGTPISCAVGEWPANLWPFPGESRAKR